MENILIKLFPYSMLLLGQLAISLNVTVSKQALGVLNPYPLCGLRFFFSTSLLALLCLIKRPRLLDPRHPQGALQPYDYWQILGEGLSGGFFFNILYYFGLKFTTATSTGILSSTLPMFIAILAYFILKEHISRQKWIAITFSIIGVLALSVDNTPIDASPAGSWVGDSLVLAAMLPEAMYSIFSRNLKHRVTALPAALLANLLTFVMFIPFILWDWTFVITSLTEQPILILLTFTGGFASAVFFWCWPVGLQYVPTSTAALFGGVLPVATAIMAFAFLGEDFHLSDAIGMAFVIGAILFGALEKTKVRENSSKSSNEQSSVS